MFSMLESLAKATIGVVVETPIAVVADVVTMGGQLTDKKEPYTPSAVKRVVGNVEKACK